MKRRILIVVPVWVGYACAALALMNAFNGLCRIVVFFGGK
jgi:hypothetical protein